MQVTVITHTDTDGIFCGGIIKSTHPDARIIQTNYGKTIDFSQLTDNQLLYVTDFSFSLEVMQELDRKYNLIWIDHHPVINEYKALGFNPKGLRSLDCSAAQLVWQHEFPDQPVPRSVQYVSDYDIWAHKYPESLLFFYGFGTVDLYLNNWKGMSTFNSLLYDEKYVDVILGVGKKIKQYIDTHNDIVCKDAVFKTTLSGYSALACNIKNTNSLLFSSSKEKSDILILYSYFSNIEQYRVSLFTNKENVAVNGIAKSYGGGGHPGAAGFTCRTLPFELPKPATEHPSYENIFQSLREQLNNEPLIRKYVNSGLVPLLLSHSFALPLNNNTFKDEEAASINSINGNLTGKYSSVCINHPSVHSEIFYLTGINYQYDLGICVSLTNTGWYRYRICVLNPTINIYDVKEYIGIGEIVDNSIWVYSKRFISVL